MNDDGTEMSKLYHTQNFEEGEIQKIASRFRTMGLKKIESITLTGKCKLTEAEVVELFYPEKNEKGIVLTEIQRKVKESLLSLYVKEKSDDNPEKLRRVELFKLSAELLEAGLIEKAPAKNIPTDKLEELVANANK
ncbi:MAG: hypothetical protein WCX48_10115 [Bacteroidales bacterium]|jgi:hypothetical protein